MFIKTATTLLIIIIQSLAFQVPYAKHQPTKVKMADTVEDVQQTTEASSALLQKDEEMSLELDSVDTNEIKERLLDLLPRMLGTSEEFRAVESYVNSLEARYTPVQTLGFLNLAMTGEWQLLFSTNLSGGPKPNFRLREMFQRVESNSTDPLKGTVANEVFWELAEDSNNFDASGTFTALCNYEINQGSRMIMSLGENTLRLAKGSAVPKDVETLVGLIHRAMPKEMFDPNDHAMDTTYLDGDLRIVRYSGAKFEGVRDIFIRRGSMEINPTRTEEES